MPQSHGINLLQPSVCAGELLCTVLLAVANLAVFLSIVSGGMVETETPSGCLCLSLCSGVSYIAPHLNNLYFLSLCRRCGVYAVVRGLFFLKLALSVVMLLAGPDQVYLLCIFIASNRVFTEGTCKLLNLVVTDLVDEDLVLNRRKQAASALLFGMVALVTKPGQTFAPLIGTWLLCAYTGYDIFQRNPLNNVVSAQPKLESAAALEPTLRQGCFYLLVFVPITCALLQLLSWSQFSLHGKRLQMVKAQRQSLTQGQAPDIKTI